MVIKQRCEQFHGDGIGRSLKMFLEIGARERRMKYSFYVNIRLRGRDLLLITDSLMTEKLSSNRGWFVTRRVPRLSLPFTPLFSLPTE